MCKNLMGFLTNFKQLAAYVIRFGSHKAYDKINKGTIEFDTLMKILVFKIAFIIISFFFQSCSVGKSKIYGRKKLDRHIVTYETRTIGEFN
jgi:hypothetical protein